MRVVVAVDKFKGSASGPEVAAALTRGLRSARPDLDVVTVPVADGGDGSLDALLANGFTAVPVTARGPLGEERVTRFGIQGEVAFIELAEVCGIQLLPHGTLDPWTAGTFGLGQVVRAALDHGAQSLLLGLGGSASTDGGLGLLLALGARATGTDGTPVTPDAAGMAAATTLDLSDLDPRLGAVAVVAVTDVTNPLTGPRGAARVFGPQKGATEPDVVRLEAALGRWAQLLREATGRQPDVPGAGAAGGVGAAVVAALGGTVASGADHILDSVGFDRAVVGATLVIAGEGSWDAQTDAGKVPSRVLARAGRFGVPVAVVAGRIASGTDFPPYVVSRTSLVQLEPEPERAMARVVELLEEVGRELGRGLGRGLGGGLPD